MKTRALFYWLCLIFWVLVVGVWMANAAPFLTFDCTPVADAVTGASLQFGAQTAIDVPVVGTCGAGADKVTCVDPAQKTICYDLGTMPNGPFSVKALVKNAWGSSAFTNPLSGTKAAPSSPQPLRILTQ
jgi:hypothetical protein